VCIKDVPTFTGVESKRISFSSSRSFFSTAMTAAAISVGVNGNGDETELQREFPVSDF
jgi:hypothetical protein